MTLTTSMPSGALGSETESNQVSIETLTQWLEIYKKAWLTRDAELVATLFTEDVTYQDNPFDQPHLGPQGVKAYWTNITRDQRDIHFQYQVIGVTGNTGIAQWSARFAVANTDTHIELEGVFVLQFSATGKCHNLREWWHLRNRSPAGAEK